MIIVKDSAWGILFPGILRITYDENWESSEKMKGEFSEQSMQDLLEKSMEKNR